MIKSYSHLSAIIKYSISDIQTIIADKEKYYYHFSQSKGIVKGEEKFRLFQPSKRELRDIQNRLQSKVFSNFLMPSHLHGGVTSRGNVTNTKPHQGKLFKLHTDLRSYFEFVSNKHVYKALLDQGFSPNVSHIITDLTTFKGHLPQGAPTSPFLANISGLAMDKDLLVVCQKHDITYTRFVDDLCFSSQNDFKEVILELIAIINKHGFFIGYHKTKYKKGRLEVTGVNIGQNLLRPTKKQLSKYNNAATSNETRKGLDYYFAGLKKKMF